MNSVFFVVHVSDAALDSADNCREAARTGTRVSRPCYTTHLSISYFFREYGINKICETNEILPSTLFVYSVFFVWFVF
ncbi:MAG: hypothetical protein LBQ66_11150, partial [Planctomycetaceae bacterium]|nr:hypothetical protein [Planctomycetaceae bacterium]